MKITEILKARQAIATIYKEKISSKLAYKLTKFLKETDTEESFYKEKLNNIINECGVKDENGHFVEEGNGIKIKDNEKEKCFSLITELESTDVDVPKTSFLIDEFNEIKISTEIMASLFAFIKE